MAIRVGINGFGRIGRLFLRAAKASKKDFDFVGINDLAEVEQLALLLRYDSIHGPYPGRVEPDGQDLIVDGDRIRVHRVSDKREGDPFPFPWGDVGADIVVEATGIFTRIAELERHLAAPESAARADRSFVVLVILGVLALALGLLALGILLTRWVFRALGMA